MRLKAFERAKDALVKRVLRPKPPAAIIHPPRLTLIDGRSHIRKLFTISRALGLDQQCASTSIAPPSTSTTHSNHHPSLRPARASSSHSTENSVQFLSSISDRPLKIPSALRVRAYWIWPNRLPLASSIECHTSVVTPWVRMMSDSPKAATGDETSSRSVRQLLAPFPQKLEGLKWFGSGHQGASIPGGGGMRQFFAPLSNRLEGLKRFGASYKEAAGIHLEAFWKQNYWLLMGAAGVAVCLFLWRIMFGVASVFVGFSEGMAEFGFFALAAALVIFAGLVLRARYSINPDVVYRIAMRKLNSTPGVLEVMGPPLVGTDVRAYVMSGGGFHFKNFKLRLSRKRCFLMFPLQGTERRALVSCEVKKNKGKYDFKLLALDLPTAQAGEQRLFLIGDEDEYKVAGGLISELRDPIIKAIAAQVEFDVQDEKELEEEAEKAKEEAKAQAEAEAAQLKAEAEAKVAKTKAKAEEEAQANLHK